MPLTIIRRKGSSNYFLRGNVAGTNVYRSTGTSDREAAENIRIRTEAELLQRASLGVKATVTFAEAALNYMNSGGETRFLGPILKFFGKDTQLKEIDNGAINRAAVKLYPNAGPATINRQLITPISAIMTMAAEDGLCEWRKFRRRKVVSKKTRWLTPEEFDAFANELPDHLTQIIGFMIGTGARVRETLTLQASTLYISQGQALLNTGDTKNDLARMVRFPERAARMIQARPLPQTGSVFTNQRGHPYKLRNGTGGQIKTAFNKARTRAGLGDDVTPHTLRHTWATWHYAQNRDFGALLDLGGWSKADVANIYRKIAPDDLGERLIQHGWDYRTPGQIDRLKPILSRQARQT